MSSKPTDFRSWLLRHVDESSHVGHLATDVRDDTTWPAKPAQETLQFYSEYLASEGAIPEAMAALKTAWDRYQTEQSQH